MRIFQRKRSQFKRSIAGFGKCSAYRIFHFCRIFGRQEFSRQHDRKTGGRGRHLVGSDCYPHIKRQTLAKFSRLRPVITVCAFHPAGRRQINRQSLFQFRRFRRQHDHGFLSRFRLKNVLAANLHVLQRKAERSFFPRHVYLNTVVTGNIMADMKADPAFKHLFDPAGRQSAMTDKIRLHHRFVFAVQMELRPRTRKNLLDVLFSCGVTAFAVQNPTVIVGYRRHIQGILLPSLDFQRRDRHFQNVVFQRHVLH